MWRTMGTMSNNRDYRRSARHLGGRRSVVLVACLATVALSLAACGIHVTKNGISGNILGHSFSGSRGSLPAGWPSSITMPDNYRVIAAGGTDNRWDAVLGVTGSFSSGTAAYQSKLQSAGYTISNVQTGSLPTGSSGAGSSTGSTVNATSSVFTAKNAQWTLEVITGTTSASTDGDLKPGEFAVNITAAPPVAGNS